MDGTEMVNRGGLTFQIEHQHSEERYPGLYPKNPRLWWVTVSDPTTFGDAKHHELTGGVQTKKHCNEEIEKHLRVKQAKQMHRERMDEAGVTR